MKRRVLAIIMVIAIVFTVVPIPVHAYVSHPEGAGDVYVITNPYKKSDVDLNGSLDSYLGTQGLYHGLIKDYEDVEDVLHIEFANGNTVEFTKGDLGKSLLNGVLDLKDSGQGGEFNQKSMADLVNGRDDVIACIINPYNKSTRLWKATETQILNLAFLVNYNTALSSENVRDKIEQFLAKAKTSDDKEYSLNEVCIEVNRAWKDYLKIDRTIGVLDSYCFYPGKESTAVVMTSTYKSTNNAIVYVCASFDAKVGTSDIIKYNVYTSESLLPARVMADLYSNAVYGAYDGESEEEAVSQYANLLGTILKKEFATSYTKENKDDFVKSLEFLSRGFTLTYDPVTKVNLIQAKIPFSLITNDNSEDDKAPFELYTLNALNPLSDDQFMLSVEPSGDTYGTVQGDAVSLASGSYEKKLTSGSYKNFYVSLAHIASVALTKDRTYVDKVGTSSEPKKTPYIQPKYTKVIDGNSEDPFREFIYSCAEALKDLQDRSNNFTWVKGFEQSLNSGSQASYIFIPKKDVIPSRATVDNGTGITKYHPDLAKLLGTVSRELMSSNASDVQGLFYYWDNNGTPELEYLDVSAYEPASNNLQLIQNNLDRLKVDDPIAYSELSRDLKECTLNDILAIKEYNDGGAYKTLKEIISSSINAHKEFNITYGYLDALRETLAQVDSNVACKIFGVDNYNSGFLDNKQLKDSWNEELIYLGTALGVEYTKSKIESFHTLDLDTWGLAIKTSVVAGSLGAYVLNNLSNGSIGADTIFTTYDEALEAIASAVYSSPADEAGDKFLAELPRQSVLSSDRFKLLARNDSENYRIVINTLYNVSLAFEMMNNSELGSEWYLSAKDMKAAITGTASSQSYLSWITKDTYEGIKRGNLPAQNPEITSLYYLRAVIELHDLCELFQISKDDWSDSIKEYLQLYEDENEFFTQLRKWTPLYNFTEYMSSSTSEPLAQFFTLDNQRVSDYWAQGFALSSGFVPLKTNVYDAANYADMDENWVSDFFYTYGFYRKALYISNATNSVSSAYVGSYTASESVCTLQTLLDRMGSEITLSVDRSFYNADKVQKALEVDLSKYTKESSESKEEQSNSDSETVENGFNTEITYQAHLNMDELLKTGASTSYSSEVVSKVTKLEDYTVDSEPLSVYDSYLVSPDLILGSNGYESVLGLPEYSVLQPYALVSTIYRCDKLFNECTVASLNDSVVLRASKSLKDIYGTSYEQWRTYYNYKILEGLYNKLDNTSELIHDKDLPIFIDIFGNIVSYSGFVLIPAAANATLTQKYWDPYSIGFAQLYAASNKDIKSDFKEDVATWLIGHSLENESTSFINSANKVEGGGYFEFDDDNQLVLKDVIISNSTQSLNVSWNHLNYSSKLLKEMFFSSAYYDKASKMYSSTLVGLITEVLRGAPLENIDLEVEGLVVQGNKSVLVFTAKVIENIIRALQKDNFKGANIASYRIPYSTEFIKILGLYLFKIAIVVTLAVVIIQTFRRAIQGLLNISGVVTFIAKGLLIVAGLFILPILTTESFTFVSNKLLRPEMEVLTLGDYLSEFSSEQVNITDVTHQDRTADAPLIKVGQVSSNLLSKSQYIYNSNIQDLVEDTMREDLAANPFSHIPDVVIYDDELFYPTANLLNLTQVVYYPQINCLVNQQRSSVGSETLATNLSYITPYFYILDVLTQSVNQYNYQNNISAFVWNLADNSSVVTYDLCREYFNSLEFMDEGFDSLNLYNEFFGSTSKISPLKLSLNSTDGMLNSYWYPEEGKLTLERDIAETYKYTREWVIRNQKLIGVVPDEVFIKMVALVASLKWNDTQGLKFASAVECSTVSIDSLVKLAVAKPNDVYANFNYSLPRFMLETSNGVALILMLFAYVSLWILALVKPLMLGFIIAFIIILLIRAMFDFKEDKHIVEGFIISSFVLTLIQIGYALALKLMINLGTIIASDSISMLILLILNLLYVGSMLYLCYALATDPAQIGYTTSTVATGKVLNALSKVVNTSSNFVRNHRLPTYETAIITSEDPNTEYGLEAIKQMLSRDHQRHMQSEGVENNSESTDDNSEVK